MMTGRFCFFVFVGLTVLPRAQSRHVRKHQVELRTSSYISVSAHVGAIGDYKDALRECMQAAKTANEEDSTDEKLSKLHEAGKYALDMGARPTLYKEWDKTGNMDQSELMSKLGNGGCCTGTGMTRTEKKECAHDFYYLMRVGQAGGTGNPSACNWRNSHCVPQQHCKVGEKGPWAKGDATSCAREKIDIFASADETVASLEGVHYQGHWVKKEGPDWTSCQALWRHNVGNGRRYRMSVESPRISD